MLLTPRHVSCVLPALLSTTQTAHAHPPPKNHPLLQLHDYFDDVGDEAPPPPGTDVSAEEWLRAKGASELQLEVADVCYANDFGASLGQLGLREMIVENQR